MSLKTIRAGSMADALAQVKRDIGPDAVILRTRTLKAGGVMGLGARSIVEITASHADDAPPMARPRPARRPAIEIEPKAQVQTPAPASAQPETTRAASAPTEPVTLRPGRSRAIASLVTTVRPNPQDDQASAALEVELSSIKKMVGELLHTTRSAAEPASAARASGVSSNVMADLYASLIDAELGPDLADAVFASAREELSPGEQADEGVARATLIRLLGERLPVGDPGLREPPTGARLAFVGPTGVGKTTTIAKLAATYALRERRRVGLITADTYRIAAVEQLRTYAGIIGVPLKVVLTPEEMAHAVDSMRDCDVVLVDTAGRSPGDAARLDELAAVVDAIDPDVTCLTLSATSSGRSLSRVIGRFEALGPNAVALTKLDETDTPGPAVTAVAAFGRPIAMLSTGQEVPDQFEWADRERLAQRLLSVDAAL